MRIPPIASASGPTADVYARIRKAAGKVPNIFAAIGAHGPAALNAILDADAVLASSTLSKRDQETIKLLEVNFPPCQGRASQGSSPEILSYRRSAKAAVARRRQKRSLPDSNKMGTPAPGA
jgi:hypothetical protein